MNDVPNRNAIRTGFAALLPSFYIINDAQATVFPNYTEDLGGVSPAVVCADSGLDPQPLTPTTYQAGVYIQVMHYVKKGEGGNAGYTKADADALLSAMTMCLMRAVRALREHDVWVNITFNGRSTIRPYKLGGIVYWGEFFELGFLATG